MSKITEVVPFGNLGTTSLRSAFALVTSSPEMPAHIPSTVTDLTFMFFGATAFNQDIGSWDTSAVTKMGNMFSYASAFNRDLSRWCVTNVTLRPTGFDDRADAWVLPRPVWGSCVASAPG